MLGLIIFFEVVGVCGRGEVEGMMVVCDKLGVRVDKRKILILRKMGN